MIIVGAGNLGKLILDQMLMDQQISEDSAVVFFDEKTNSKLIFDKYPVVNNIETVKEYCIGKSEKYFVAIGNSRIRNRYDTIMSQIPGIIPMNIISSYSRISNFSKICEHLYLGFLTGIYHSCVVGYCNIIHSYVKIDHGVVIGNYVNISTGVTLLADCQIGDFTFVGANAIVLPGVIIGRNCYITAGTIVRENMNDYETR